MKEDVLVSIVIPTYNRGALLIKTLDSVLKQTYKNWECIIVDDGSSKEFNDLIINFINKDTRFKYVSLPHTGNANIGRNKGISVSKGEFIAMLDSDDLWLSDHLESRLKSIGNADGVYGGNIFLKNNKEIIFETRKQLNSESNFEFVFFSGVPKCTPSLILRSEAIKEIKWDERLFRHQDYDFLIRFLSKFKLNMDKNITVKVNGNNNRNSSFNFKGCVQFYSKYYSDFLDYPDESKLYLLAMSKRALFKKEMKYIFYYTNETRKYGLSNLKLIEKLYVLLFSNFYRLTHQSIAKNN